MPAGKPLEPSRKIRRLAWFIGLVLVTTGGAEAQDSDSFRVTRAFFGYDQDGWHTNWLVPEQDHAYTGGAHAFVAFTGARVSRLARFLFWDDEGLFYAAGVGAKLRVFTPDNVTTVAEPGPDERPYAGWLTSSFAIQQRSQRVEDHLGVEIGVVGPSSQASSIQQGIHPALGWHTQLGNQLTVNIRARRAWKVAVGSESPRSVGFEAVPELSADLGNVYRRATGGLTLKAGFRLPRDFVAPRIDDPGSLSGEALPRSGYVFLRGATHLVAHNIFLDGDASATSRSVSREPAVGELELGVVVQLGPRAAAQWSWTRISDEFKTDPLADSYGALLIRFNF